jgi:large-conductance mechanosensitive channel
MTLSNDEAKRNFLNILKAIVFEGRPRDWVVVMLLLAVPITVSFSLSTILNSFISNLLAPMIFYPILTALSIDRLASWKIGWLSIGSFLSDFINICFDLILLFALTRILRRFI